MMQVKEIKTSIELLDGIPSFYKIILEDTACELEKAMKKKLQRELKINIY